MTNSLTVIKPSERKEGWYFLAMIYDKGPEGFRLKYRLKDDDEGS